MTVNHQRPGRTLSHRRHAIYGLLLLLFGCFLFWKCRYGYANIDEAFYLTIPYRLYQGDSLLVHEWHMSQMSALLNLPAVSLFVSVTGGTTGIVLFMRYLCTTAQIATAAFIYSRFHKLHWLGAVVASLSCLIYTPFGVMAPSYNTLGLMATVLSTVIVLTAQTRKPLQYTIAGLIYAAAVLCCPFLAIVFFLYLAVVAVMLLVRKCRHQDLHSEFYFWTFPGAFFLTLGAGIAAAAFFAFLLSRSKVGDILHSLPVIFSDPEHPILPLSEMIESFIRNILEINPWSKPIHLTLTGLAIVCLLDKQRIRHRLIYFPIASIGYFLLILSYWIFRPYINYFMWPMNLLAPFVLLLSRDKNIKKILSVSWTTGMLYAFCINASSNQIFYVISSTSTVATVGSILCIALFLQEIKDSEEKAFPRSFAAALVGLIFATQLCSQTVSRYNSVFWEPDGMPSLTVKIDTGIDAGVYASEMRAQEYYEALENLQVLQSYDFENVLFLSRNTWYYLLGDYRSAAYSAWLSAASELDINIFGTYLSIARDKWPDLVYADGDYTDFAEEYAAEFGYTIDRTEPVYVLIRAPQSEETQ